MGWISTDYLLSKNLFKIFSCWNEILFCSNGGFSNVLKWVENDSEVYLKNCFSLMKKWHPSRFQSLQYVILFGDKLQLNSTLDTSWNQQTGGVWIWMKLVIVNFQISIIWVERESSRRCYLCFCVSSHCSLF